MNCEANINDSIDKTIILGKMKNQFNNRENDTDDNAGMDENNLKIENVNLKIENVDLKMENDDLKMENDDIDIENANIDSEDEYLIAATSSPVKNDDLDGRNGFDNKLDIKYEMSIENDDFDSEQDNMQLKNNINMKYDDTKKTVNTKHVKTKNKLLKSRNATQILENEKYDSEIQKNVLEPEFLDCDKNVLKLDSEPIEPIQPRIVMCIKKPKRKKNVNNILKRSLRQKSTDESVLQSAIARKEKSYNESNKPQRLTRQLKPTQKILENIANAAALRKNKDVPNKNVKLMKFKTDGKHLKKKGKGCTKKIKENSNNKNYTLRKSERISFSRSKEDSDDISLDLEEPITDKSEETFESSHSVVEAQLIASRLCLCNQTTQLYVSDVDCEIVYCAAVDNLRGKLIGCNMKVDHTKISMLRPSGRIPYTVLCEVHKQRMLRHNCCPTCGIFCTEGRFSQCRNKHQYHRDCQISVGKVECCPHCGQSTPDFDIYITMQNPKVPMILETQV